MEFCLVGHSGVFVLLRVVMEPHHVIELEKNLSMGDSNALVIQRKADDAKIENVQVPK